MTRPVSRLLPIIGILLLWFVVVAIRSGCGAGVSYAIPSVVILFLRCGGVATLLVVIRHEDGSLVNVQAEAAFTIVILVVLWAADGEGHASVSMRDEVVSWSDG